MKHQTGLWKAFDLSAWAYFLDFALVPIALVFLVPNAIDSDGVLAALLWIGIGLLIWTLVEYWIYRLLFHGRTLFEPMHQEHHRLPKAMIGVASWGTFSAFAAIWLVCGSAFTAGLMAGYLAYCAIHVRMHHHARDARLSRYIALMHAHHVGHHRGGHGNFGVSSPLWDFVFATYRPTSIERKSP